QPGGEAVLDVNRLQPAAALRRPLGNRRAQHGLRVLDLADQPTDGVDRMGAPRADPPATELSPEQPAVGPQRQARARAVVGPGDVLDGADGALLEQARELDPRRLVA